MTNLGGRLCPTLEFGLDLRSEGLVSFPLP